MNSISTLLARAKAAAAPRLEVATARRVRPLDGSCAPGFVFAEEDGWIYWCGDDAIDHCSRPDYVEDIR